MNERELLLNYIKGLLKQWYVIVALVFGLIDIFILPFFDIEIPWWVFLSLFGLSFIAANYQLYQQTHHKIKQLQDEHHRQLGNAQTEIDQLKNREPRLELIFADTKTQRATLTVFARPESIDVDKLVEQEAAALEEAYANKDAVSEEDIGFKTIASMMNSLRGPLKSRKEYEEECKRYLKQYRQFIEDREAHKVYSASYRTLAFVIENTGTRPAEEITVVMDFPDEFIFPLDRDKEGFSVIDVELLKVSPTPPPTPSLYKPGPLEQIGRMSSFPYTGLSEVSPRYPGTDLGHSNVSGPFIRPKNSTEVTYEIAQLMHNFIEEFGPVGFFVREDAVGRSLEIKYAIHAANLMRPLNRSLIVSVELIEEG